MSPKSDLQSSHRSQRKTDTKSRGAGWPHPLKIVPPVLLAAIAATVFISMGRGTPLTSDPVTQSNPQARTDPPGTIDGAKNPELIPDDVAYRAVLLGIAERENATDQEKARFEAKIASAGLSADDKLALLVILAAFQKQMDALNAQISEVLQRDPVPLAGTPDYQQLVDLTKDREPIFVEALSAIPARLGAEGAAKFQAYIQNQKRNMKYLPDTAVPKP
jgi:hypothetical protein